MNNKKSLIILSLIAVISLSSCGTIKDGFTNQKKYSSDEFLVEKKLPLVMPPDYKNLPMPKTDNQVGLGENRIKDLLIKKKIETEESNSTNDLDINFEQSIIKKIKKTHVNIEN